MRSMQQFWIAVNAASDMFEQEPVEGSFDQWLGKTWPAYEKMCIQIAQHYYIMHTASKQWSAESPTAFVDAIERKRLQKLCEDVGLDPREFVSSAFTRHKNACLKGD